MPEKKKNKKKIVIDDGSLKKTVGGKKGTFGSARKIQNLFNLKQGNDQVSSPRPSEPDTVPKISEKLSAKFSIF